MTTKGVKTLDDLNNRQRRLYDLLVGSYSMKPHRALMAVYNAILADKPLAVAKAPPWSLGKDGSWLLTCQRCNRGLQTDQWSMDDAADMAIRLGWKATEHVVRCPTCRALLR